jgi:hypothetical protein
MLNIIVHPGSAHSAFLRAGPRVPIAETEARRPRAPRSGRGRDAARRSEPGPTHPAPRGDPAVGPPPPLCCPSPPLKRIHRPPTDLFLPRAPFVSSVHVQAPHARPHCPGVHLTSFPPPKPLLRAGLCPSVTAVRPPSGERPSELLLPSIDRRLLTPGSPSNCRTQPPSSATTGATPPPLNTAAPTASRRPTIARSSR